MAAAAADDDLWATPQRPGSTDPNASPVREPPANRFETPLSPVGEARLRRRSRIVSDPTTTEVAAQRRCVCVCVPILLFLCPFVLVCLQRCRVFLSLKDTSQHQNLPQRLRKRTELQSSISRCLTVEHNLTCRPQRPHTRTPRGVFSPSRPRASQIEASPPDLPQCSVCLDNLLEPVTLSCGHTGYAAPSFLHCFVLCICSLT